MMPPRLRRTAGVDYVLALGPDLARDANYSLRVLARRPGFTTVAVLSLALGIGAGTAIFSLVKGVLLRPLPYPEADQLCTAWVVVPRLEHKFPSLPARARDFLAWQRASTSFTGLAALAPRSLNLTGDGAPERVGGLRVSANLFGLLGVQPRLGRAFTAQEDQPGAEHVAIISHALWVRRFAADPGLVGRTITLDGERYTVIGVWPADFLFPGGTRLNPHLPLSQRLDIWLPMALSPAEIEAKGDHNFAVLGRLAPGLGLVRAQAELEAVVADFARRDLNGAEFRVRLVPLSEAFVGRVRTPLFLLAAAAAVLLLIACVNLANLLFVSLRDRAQEFAMRQALGAGARHLWRHVLTESLLVTLSGGAMGAWLARPVVVLLVRLAPAEIPRLQEVEVDRAALLFSLGVSLVTGVLAGWLPAWRVLEGFSGAQLKRGGAATGARGGRPRMWLVTTEVALSTGLLLLGGLLAHSLVKLTRLDPGFTARHVLTADIALPVAVYRQAPEWTSFYGTLVERLRVLPDVEAAGATSALPLSSAGGSSLAWRGSRGWSDERPLVAVRAVTAGYFEALDIPLRAGRLLADVEPTAVVVIGESLAYQFWPGRPADAVVGEQLRLGRQDSAALEIVGVVGDIRGARLEDEPVPHAYRPYAQRPTDKMSVVVRTRHAPLNSAGALRAAVHSLDRGLPVTELTTLERSLAVSLAPRRFQLWLVMVFASLALVLALSGTYAAVSDATRGRTREIGVRLALGAQPREVLALVWGQGLVPVGLGIVAGLAGAAAGAAALRSTLFGTSPLDPAVLASVAGAVLLTGGIACYVPARWAADVDPTATMRCE